MEKLNNEQKKLVEDNIKLIYYVINNFKIPIDDYLDLGYIGLCKSALTYDSSKNIKFSTYATNCIRNEIITEFIKNGKNKGYTIISLQDYMNKESNGYTYSEAIKDDNQDIEKDVLLSDLVDNIFEFFNDKPVMQFIMQEIMNGKTQQEIASQLGVKRESVCSRIKTIKRTLKRNGYKKELLLY